MYKNLPDLAWLKRFLFLGIKRENSHQHVLEPLGSYMRVFATWKADKHIKMSFQFSPPSGGEDGKFDRKQLRVGLRISAE